MPKKGRKSKPQGHRSNVNRLGSGGARLCPWTPDSMPPSIESVRKIANITLRHSETTMRPIVVLQKVMSMLDAMAPYEFMNYANVCRAMEITSMIMYHSEQAALAVLDGTIAQESVAEVACEAVGKAILDHPLCGKFEGHLLTGFIEMTQEHFGWGHLVLRLDDRLSEVWHMADHAVDLKAMKPLEDPAWTDEERAYLSSQRCRELEIPPAMVDAVSLGERFFSDMTKRFGWVEVYGPPDGGTT